MFNMGKTEGFLEPWMDEDNDFDSFAEWSEVVMRFHHEMYEE